ncbi:hypothetical protein GOODEAATRI_020019 [Goodea atripinnis]|uniref:Uncharacterized protein n=1 Tax=Goodea atripinnis TaxID=208336 RepID=A0ABV0N648_9TELE
MSSQDKRDVRRRPCPWPLKQQSSLSCLQASLHSLLFQAEGHSHTGPQCETGRRHATDGCGCKEIRISGLFYDLTLLSP